MCPAISTRGPSLVWAQITEPFLSAANGPMSVSSSVKIARTSSSWPETEWASVSSCNRERAFARMGGGCVCPIALETHFLGSGLPAH